MPPEGWYHSLSALLVDLQVFASQDAAIAARRLYRATMNLGSGTVGTMKNVDGLSGRTAVMHSAISTRTKLSCQDGDATTAPERHQTASDTQLSRRRTKSHSMPQIACAAAIRTCRVACARRRTLLPLSARQGQ